MVISNKGIVIVIATNSACVGFIVTSIAHVVGGSVVLIVISGFGSIGMVITPVGVINVDIINLGGIIVSLWRIVSSGTKVIVTLGRRCNSRRDDGRRSFIDERI
jgi:hypothetical protein